MEAPQKKPWKDDYSSESHSEKSDSEESKKEDDGKKKVGCSELRYKLTDAFNPPHTEGFGQFPSFISKHGDKVFIGVSQTILTHRDAAGILYANVDGKLEKIAFIPGDPAFPNTESAVASPDFSLFAVAEDDGGELGRIRLFKFYCGKFKLISSVLLPGFIASTFGLNFGRFAFSADNKFLAASFINSTDQNDNILTRLAVFSVPCLKLVAFEDNQPGFPAGPSFFDLWDKCSCKFRRFITNAYDANTLEEDGSLTPHCPAVLRVYELIHSEKCKCHKDKDWGKEKKDYKRDEEKHDKCEKDWDKCCKKYEEDKKEYDEDKKGWGKCCKEWEKRCDDWEKKKCKHEEKKCHDKCEEKKWKEEKKHWEEEKKEWDDNCKKWEKRCEDWDKCKKEWKNAKDDYEKEEKDYEKEEKDYEKDKKEHKKDKKEHKYKLHLVASELLPAAASSVSPFIEQCKQEKILIGVGTSRIINPEDPSLFFETSSSFIPGDDHNLRVYQFDAKKLKLVYREHIDGSLNEIAWYPDGKYLAFPQVVSRFAPDSIVNQGAAIGTRRVVIDKCHCLDLPCGSRQILPSASPFAYTSYSANGKWFLNTGTDSNSGVNNLALYYVKNSADEKPVVY